MLDFINVNLQRLNNNTIIFQNRLGFFKFVLVASDKSDYLYHTYALILEFIFRNRGTGFPSSTTVSVNILAGRANNSYSFS